jgi:hypothetical protein
MAMFTVCLVNATKRDSNGETIRGDAYLGQDLEFSTLDASQAKQFDQFEADLFADHWRGWYRGFHGGYTIEVRPV